MKIGVLTAQCERWLPVSSVTVEIQPLPNNGTVLVYGGNALDLTLKGLCVASQVGHQEWRVVVWPGGLVCGQSGGPGVVGWWLVCGQSGGPPGVVG